MKHKDIDKIKNKYKIMITKTKLYENKFSITRSMAKRTL